MRVRSKASTRARSGWPGPGSPAADGRGADARALGERTPQRERDALVGRQSEQPRHRVLELSDVAGPGVRSRASTSAGSTSTAPMP